MARLLKAVKATVGGSSACSTSLLYFWMPSVWQDGSRYHFVKSLVCLWGGRKIKFVKEFHAGWTWYKCWRKQSKLFLCWYSRWQIGSDPFQLAAFPDSIQNLVAVPSVMPYPEEQETVQWDPAAFRELVQEMLPCAGADRDDGHRATEDEKHWRESRGDGGISPPPFLREWEWTVQIYPPPHTHTHTLCKGKLI